MIPVAIAGAGGRMGRALVEAVIQTGDIMLSGALDVRGAPLIGSDAGLPSGASTGAIVTDDIAAAIAGARCFIDFTRPEGTLRHLAACRAAGVAMVIGTTGFDAPGKRAIEEAAADIPIVFAPNMSVGVNVTFKLLEIAARILDGGYDVEIIEAHHRHKVDAPSGTALGMGEVIARSQGKDLQHDAIFGREGVTGERPIGRIGFASVRGGDIVGDHTVLFAGEGERIEITHRASSRMTYAQGSLRACRFLAPLKHGLHDMQDVLGLSARQ